MKKDLIQMMAGFSWKDECDDQFDDYICLRTAIDNHDKWIEELSDVEESTNIYIYFRVNDEVEFAFLPANIFHFLEMIWLQKQAFLKGKVVISSVLEEYLIFSFHAEELQILSIQGIVTVDVATIANEIIDNDSSFYSCENVAVIDLIQQLQNVGGRTGRSFRCPFAVWQNSLDSIIQELSDLLQFLIDDPSEIGKNWKLPVSLERQSQSEILNDANYFLSQRWKSGIEEIRNRNSDSF